MISATRRLATREGALTDCMAISAASTTTPRLACRDETGAPLRALRRPGSLMETLEDWSSTTVSGGAGGETADRPYILEFDALFPLELTLFSSAEAQAAAVADDIATTLTTSTMGCAPACSNWTTSRRRFTGGLLAKSRLFIQSRTAKSDPRTDAPRHNPLRRGRHRRVAGADRQRRAQKRARHSRARRRAGGFSPAMAQAEREVKRFLFEHMYRHAKVMSVWKQAREAISFLFPAFMRTRA